MTPPSWSAARSSCAAARCRRHARGTRAAQHEHLIALDGKTYTVDPSMCVIADAAGERPIGLGGVMGGESTGCSDETADVFVEMRLVRSRSSRPRPAATLGISSDAQYRFARGVDPAFVVPGLELATRLILDLCGGEPSEIVVAGEAPGQSDGLRLRSRPRRRR